MRVTANRVILSRLFRFFLNLVGALLERRFVGVVVIYRFFGLYLFLGVRVKRGLNVFLGFFFKMVLAKDRFRKYRFF